MVWSSDAEITVRLTARGDDEIWVLARSGLLIRFVAASDGDMGDVAKVVRRIGAGEALDADQAPWAARIGGLFAVL